MNPIGGTAASVWSDYDYYDYSDEALNSWACMPGCSLPTGTTAKTTGDTVIHLDCRQFRDRRDVRPALRPALWHDF